MKNDDAVLHANTSFYAAFAHGDITAMEQLWHNSQETTCIHPGWSALHGSDIILETFRRIFETDSNAPNIECHGAQVNQHGDLALVTCYEVIDGSVLAATNAFIQSNDSWKLIHHQAGPVNTTFLEDNDEEEDEDEDEGPDRTLH